MRRWNLNHRDHVQLLKDGVPGSGGTWADLGAGRGAFTLALAELIGPEGVIYAVDRDARALRHLQQAMATHYPQIMLKCMQADFTRSLALPRFDGVVMANSLHFVQQKDATLQLVHSSLKPGGRLLLVEYNTDRGNMWVPYPLSYESWAALSVRNGFEGARLLATTPSSFLQEFYAAESLKPIKS